jgi:hypothetical protein
MLLSLLFSFSLSFFVGQRSSLLGQLQLPHPHPHQILIYSIFGLLSIWKNSKNFLSNQGEKSEISSKIFIQSDLFPLK